MYSIDLFVAAAPEDQQLARTLALGLKSLGLSVFLPPLDLMPGDFIDQSLQEMQDAARATVVVVTKNTAKHWETAESIRRAIDLVQSGLTHRVIPVLEPETLAKEVPFGLARLHGVTIHNRSVDAATHKIRDLLDYQGLLEVAEAMRVARKELRILQASGATIEAIEVIQQRYKAAKRRLRAGRQPRPGDILGDRFELHERLGSGGFGTVWRATDEKSGACVALKILHGQWTYDRSVRERFFRGARQMHRFMHSSIVRIVDPHVEDDKFPCYAMEYMPHGDLRDAMLTGLYGLRDGIAATLAVATALSETHRKNVVHRDVKPSNILIGPDGQFKLSDFDLVNAPDTTGLTRTGALGSAFFAAPEAMVDASKADRRADIFSLGKVLMFACHVGLNHEDLPPEAHTDTYAFLASSIIPETFREIISRATSRQPENRYQSVDDFRADLLIARSGEQAWSLASARLEIEISADYDTITVILYHPDATLRLPRSRQNELLWLLARRRLSDRQSGVDRSKEGWMYADELIPELALRASDPMGSLNTMVHRCRKSFSKLGFRDGRVPIERRAGRMRLTLVNIKILEHAKLAE